jgi:hypothetical protein
MTTDTQKADRALTSRVRQRLDDNRQSRDLASCDVAVVAGRATLTGHVRSRQIARGLIAAARGVPGVSSVDESLIADDELELRVAAAIAGSPLNRRSRLVVRSALGHVGVGGTYASNEAWAEAVRVGAATVGVVDATALRATEVSS